MKRGCCGNASSICGAGVPDRYSFGDFYNEAAITGAGVPSRYSFGDFYNEAAITGAGDPRYSFGDTYNTASFVGAGVTGGFRIPSDFEANLAKYVRMKPLELQKFGFEIMNKIFSNTEADQILDEVIASTKKKNLTDTTINRFAAIISRFFGKIYLRDCLASVILKLKTDSGSKSRITMPMKKRIQRLELAYIKLMQELDNVQPLQKKIIKIIDSHMRPSPLRELLDRRKPYAPSSLLTNLPEPSTEPTYRKYASKIASMEDFDALPYIRLRGKKKALKNSDVRGSGSCAPESFSHLPIKSEQKQAISGLYRKLSYPADYDPTPNIPLPGILITREMPPPSAPNFDFYVNNKNVGKEAMEKEALAKAAKEKAKEIAQEQQAKELLQKQLPNSMLEKKGVMDRSQNTQLSLNWFNQHFRTVSKATNLVNSAYGYVQRHETAKIPTKEETENRAFMEKCLMEWQPFFASYGVQVDNIEELADFFDHINTELKGKVKPGPIMQPSIQQPNIGVDVSQEPRGVPVEPALNPQPEEAAAQPVFDHEEPLPIPKPSKSNSNMTVMARLRGFLNQTIPILIEHLEAANKEQAESVLDILSKASNEALENVWKRRASRHTETGEFKKITLKTLRDEVGGYLREPKPEYDVIWQYILNTLPLLDLTADEEDDRMIDNNEGAENAE